MADSEEIKISEENYNFLLLEASRIQEATVDDALGSLISARPLRGSFDVTHFLA